MKFDYAVKLNGTLYKAGEEIPDESFREAPKASPKVRTASEDKPVSEKKPASKSGKGKKAPAKK